MGRFVDRPQALAGEMGVDLGRRQVRVTEQLLHGPQVGSAFQQVRSVRVPEGVGVQGPPVGQRMALHDAVGVPWAETPTPPVQEHRAGRANRAFRARVGPPAARPAASTAGAPSGTRRTLEPLPSTVTCPLGQVDVADVEPAALRDPHAGAVEDLEHGEVAQRHGPLDRIAARGRRPPSAASAGAP